jgi:hypothetical protein
MRIAGVVLALVGLLLLVPAMIVGSQMALGDLNIDTKAFHHGIIVSVLGLGCVVAGSTVAIRSFRHSTPTARKS